MKKIYLILFLVISNALLSQNERFTIKSVSINSPNNEFGTIISSDGAVYFSKSNYKNQMELDEISASLYRGQLEGKNEITKGLKFPTDAIHAVFTNDGNNVYYSKKDGENFQLYRASIDPTGRWKNNIKLPFNNPKYTFKQPSLNSDNTKLFFVSDKSDSFGSTDIYYVTISNHGLEFSDPIHLNFYVNSPGEECFPYLGEKDKLYFSSDGMGGIGGLDIYESFFNNENYENTANLGEPINSEYDDFAYTLVSGNHKGFLSSNRIGGKGGVDIYSFEDKKPSLNKCAQAIKGYVKNKSNQKPIFEVTVDLFDPAGNNETTVTDFQGLFVFDNVECEVTYDVVAYKEGFNGMAEAHVIPKNQESINLFLNPEFPEGFKEEFDFNNELVAIDVKTNEELPVENAKELSYYEQREKDNMDKINSKKAENAAIAEQERLEEQKKQAEINAKLNEAQLKAEREKEAQLAEAKKRSEELKAKETYYDPLDYDPKTQIKPVKEEVETKKEEVAQNYDPLDYDPKTQTKPVKEEVETKKEEVAQNYDPLDYDPKTQTKPVTQNPVKEKSNAIEEARLKREAAEKERQKMLAAAKEKAAQLKKEQEAKIALETKKAEEAKIEADKKLAMQKQAIEEAKKRDEAERLEKEQLALAEIEKNKQIQAEKLEAEKQAKFKQEEENKKLIAEQKAKIEEDRQKMVEEAKVTAENLKAYQEVLEKKNQEIDNVLSAAEKFEKENPDGLSDVEKEFLEMEELKRKEEENKAIAEKLKKEQEATALAEKRKEEAEKERQKMIEEAKATAERLKKEQETKTVAEAEKAEAEKERIRQLEEAKATAERLKKEQETKTIAEAQKAEAEKERIRQLEEAKATAERLKKEQETKTIAEAQKAEAEKERIRQLEEAKATAERLRKEQEAKTIAEAQKAEAEKERIRQLEEARATAERLRKEQEAKTIAEAQKAEAEKERIRQLEEARATAERLRKEQETIAIAETKIFESKTIDTKTKEARINEAKATASRLIKEKAEREHLEKITDTTDDPNKREEVCSRDISGFIRNSKTRAFMSNVEIDMYFEGQNIETVKSDPQGNFTFLNVDCNTKYTLICHKDGFDNIAKAVIDTENETKNLTILLDPNPTDAIAVKEKIVPKKSIEDEYGDEMVESIPEEPIIPKIAENRVMIEPIYFDLDEWYLTQPSRRELDKIILLMKMNPSLIIESGSHTDTRGGFDYNLELSEKRSQEAVGYLIANGADPDRISGRGYGETMPVNHCLDGIKCTELEHLQNRRTEFVILKY